MPEINVLQNLPLLKFQGGDAFCYFGGRMLLFFGTLLLREMGEMERGNGVKPKNYTLQRNIAIYFVR